MQSEQIDQVAAAFSRAQSKMKNPVFDQKNPAFNSSFASLAAVRNEVVPALTAEDMAVFQNLTTTDIGVSCETILVHKSGQSMRFGPFVVPVAKRDAWSIAGAATYAKRISLQAVCVVVGDADDDGTAAQGHKTNGDRSGRPDTSNVDPDMAASYAERMLDIVNANDPKRAQKIHWELNQDEALYTAAMDEFKTLAKENGIGKTEARDRWTALVKTKEAA